MNFPINLQIRFASHEFFVDPFGQMRPTNLLLLVKVDSSVIIRKELGQYTWTRKYGYYHIDIFIPSGFFRASLKLYNKNLNLPTKFICKSVN